jgi:4-phospho-D-threonate 3-dehydrogenase / 4-phospho-D-erythronate 3-dehydrogenase
MKPVIGITMGDPSGIGAEITVKALGSKEIYESCIPVVFGDEAAMRDAINFTNSSLKLNLIDEASEAKGELGYIDLINLGYLASGNWEYKKVCKISGEASFQYIVKAIEFAKEGKIHAVTTGPINKEAVNLAGHHFAGHTEIFAHYTDTASYAMMLTSNTLNVIHVTTHVSMRQACDIIRNGKEKVKHTIRLANEGMKSLGCKEPRIGVAGFNAHSSENGMFGDEETLSIIPAVEECKAEGINCEGPIPPDTVFVKAVGGMYDVVVAMYHDQGHIPLKFNGFKMDAATGKFTSMSGVNTTIGLPVIRTSVDHGTAFDRAGEGRANEESMIDAIKMAVTMSKNKYNR